MRKPRKHLPLWSMSVAAVAMLSASMVACGLLGPDETEFVIRVDSIEAPDTIATTAPLTARFNGFIGPDLCSSLERVEKRLTVDTLELRFHGVRKEGGNCPHAVAILDHEETVAQPMGDPFTIRVLQPGGVPLEKIVRVR